MIVLTFNVIGTDLRRTDLNRVVAVSRNNISAKFEFNSDWENVTPLIAQFSNNGAYYDAFIENGECTVPWEVLENEGTLSVAVLGGDLIITNAVKINVYGTGIVGGLTPTTASPGVYSAVVKLANEINADYNKMQSIIDTYEDTVNNSMTDISELAANAHESEMNAAESASEAKKSEISALNALEDLKNTVINIHNSVEGYTAIAMDCSDKKIDELNVYGRSSQNGIPTITVPVDIKNTFDSLSCSVYITNKNLLSAPYGVDNKLSLTASKDDYTYYEARYPFYIVEGQTYTFSFESDGNAGGTSGTDTVQAGILDTTNGIHYMTTTNKHLTFTAKKTGKCSFRCDVNKDGCTHSFWDFQVELGDVSSEYVAGEKQNINIALSEPLRGIPVNLGGNYTDSTGQQYLSDVVCIKDGQVGILRYINYIRLTSNGFTLFRNYDTGDKISFQKSLGTAYMNENCYCTHFAKSSKYETDTINTPDRRAIVTVSSDYTLDTFKSFLDDNEVYLAITCKNNPVFEPFSDDIQNQIKELKTYYGITNACNNEGTYMGMKYTADTKMYIDNKFNELATAIVATESEV